MRIKDWLPSNLWTNIASTQDEVFNLENCEESMDDEDLDLIAKKFRKTFKPKKGEK